MKAQTYFRKKLILSIFTALIVITSGTFSSVRAQAFGVSPGRIELEVKPGTERTTVLVIDYAKQKPEDNFPIIRGVARAEDWGIKSNGELITADPGLLPRSATSWMIFSPAEFTIAPDTKQVLRITISVPAETKPGDYYTSLYIEDRNPPPPPTANSPQINVKYRFYSLIYVMVPDLTSKGEITNLEAKVDQGKVTVNPTLKNSGNSHIRGIHSVEFKDENDKTVAEIPKDEATVLLGDSEMTLQMSLNKALPAGKYKVVYSIDFGKGAAVQVGKTELEITPDEATAMLNTATPASTENQTAVQETKSSPLLPNSPALLPVADNVSAKSTLAPITPANPADVAPTPKKP